jgi:hypothetical protein
MTRTKNTVQFHLRQGNTHIFHPCAKDTALPLFSRSIMREAEMGYFR